MACARRQPGRSWEAVNEKLQALGKLVWGAAHTWGDGGSNRYMPVQHNRTQILRGWVQLGLRQGTFVWHISAHSMLTWIPSSTSLRGALINSSVLTWVFFPCAPMPIFRRLLLELAGAPDAGGLPQRPKDATPSHARSAAHQRAAGWCPQAPREQRWGQLAGRWRGACGCSSGGGFSGCWGWPGTGAGGCGR